MLNLDTTAKKMVELVGEPSYTSNDHKWKGANASLINKLNKINVKPISIKQVLNNSGVAKKTFHASIKCIKLLFISSIFLNGNIRIEELSYRNKSAIYKFSL